MSLRLLPPLPYLGDDRLFLAEVELALEIAGVDGDVLHRASEADKLERLRRFGTDRGGYPERKPWREGGRLHEDVILATTADDIRRGTTENAYSTSAKKLPLIDDPLWLVYDAAAFVEVGQKEYAFRDGVDRRASLRAAFPVRKAELPRGWMSSEEGLAYRSLVDGAARPGGCVVEIGCWKGRSLSYIARAAVGRGARLVGVDHFAGSDDRYDGAYRRSLAAEDVEGELRRHLNDVLDVDAELVTLPSVDAAARFEDGSIDLVFLDASHDERSVAADLAAWSPKLRPGGVLAGHDHDHQHPGVVRSLAAALPDATIGPGSLWWHR